MSDQVIQLLQKLEKRLINIESTMVTESVMDDRLTTMKEELKEHAEGLFRDLMVAVDENKVDKSKFLKLEKRVERLEHI